MARRIPLRGNRVPAQLHARARSLQSANLLTWTPIDEATSSVSRTTLAASHTGVLSPFGKLFFRTPALTVDQIGSVQAGSPATSGSASSWNGKSLASNRKLGTMNPAGADTVPIRGESRSSSSRRSHPLKSSGALTTKRLTNGGRVHTPVLMLSPPRWCAPGGGRALAHDSSLSPYRG